MFLRTLEGLYPSLSEEPGTPGGGGEGVWHRCGVAPPAGHNGSSAESSALPEGGGGQRGRGTMVRVEREHVDRPLWTQQWSVD